MKVGEIIDSPSCSYKVTTDASNSDGGRCMWAFASNGGNEYFIKQFLEPKFPMPESMGSEASKARRKIACQEFEQRHRVIMKKLAPGAPGGGNLVTALEFFRQGTTYYKVTHKVSVESLDSLEAMKPRERAIVLRTLGHSLQMLHRQGIVHGDLKPTNVLIQKNGPSGLHVAKLIDFDDSYLSASPPPPDQIVGDSVYAGPEWFSYLKNEPGVTARDLTTQSDVFALGLMIHEYLTGSVPAFGSRFNTVAEAVAAGEELGFDDRLSPDLVRLLTRMTAADPMLRPTTKQVLEELGDENILAFGPKGGAAAPGRRRLVINDLSGGSKEAADPTPPVVPPAAKPGSRLRIRGLNTD